jgi:MoaA/NifB/PqqE/SkfB family radical SAM enzyme
MHFKSLLNLTGDHLYTLPLLVLYLTDGCNSKCVTCDIWRNPRRNMPLPLVDSLAAECEKLQTRWVLLSGGEAMQHPDWPAIAQKFRATGARVMLLTNGLLLRKQAAEVIASVDEVIVSLDAGNAATYEAIRGVDGFDLILEGIRAVRAGGIPVATRTTVQRGNFRQLPQIIDAALDAGVSTVSFLAVDVSNPFAFGQREHLHSAAVPLEHIRAQHEANRLISLIETPSTALMPDDVRELDALLTQMEHDYAAEFADGRIAEAPEKLRRILVNYFRALHGAADEYEPPRCNAPHFSTVVQVDGTLQPCYFLPAYGRLKPDGARLPAALNTPEAKTLRQAYRTGQRRECDRCVCPLYKGARNLLRM